MVRPADPHGVVDPATGQDLRGHGPGIPPLYVAKDLRSLRPVSGPADLNEIARIGRRLSIHPMTRKLNDRLKVAGFPTVEFIASPNYYPGRGGTAVDLFVQHTSVGTLAACVGRFTNAAAQVSATWALDAPRLVQFVPYDGGSYANGNWGYNMRSLTLERVDNGDYNSDATGAERNLLVVIYDHVFLDWGIPLTHGVPGFLPHKEVPGASTACPDGVGVDGLLTEAVTALSSPPVTSVIKRRPQWL